MDSQSPVGTKHQEKKNAAKGSSSDMQKGIENCMACHVICEQTLTHCLSMGGRHVEAVHLKSLIDCAQICAVSSDFMARDSAVHASVCKACSDACAACAASCEKFGDDEQMKLCAEACRKCEESCRAMSAAHH